MSIPLTEFLDTHEQALTELAAEVVRDSRAKGSSFSKPWNLYESISIIGYPRPIVLSQGYSDRRSWHEWTC